MSIANLVGQENCPKVVVTYDTWTYYKKKQWMSQKSDKTSGVLSSLAPKISVIHWYLILINIKTFSDSVYLIENFTICCERYDIPTLVVNFYHRNVLFLSKAIYYNSLLSLSRSPNELRDRNVIVHTHGTLIMACFLSIILSRCYFLSFMSDHVSRGQALNQTVQRPAITTFFV